MRPHRTSSPSTMIVGSRRISSAIASCSACAKRILAIELDPSWQPWQRGRVIVCEGLFVRRELAFATERHRLLDVAPDLGLEPLKGICVPGIKGHKLRPQARERIPALPVLDFLRRPVGL